MLKQGGKEAGDTFIQKLMAGVFRHLEVTVTDVHIRYLNISSVVASPILSGMRTLRQILATPLEQG